MQWRVEWDAASPSAKKVVLSGGAPSGGSVAIRVSLGPTDMEVSTSVASTVAWDSRACSRIVTTTLRSELGGKHSITKHHHRAPLLGRSEEEEEAARDLAGRPPPPPLKPLVARWRMGLCPLSSTSPSLPCSPRRLHHKLGVCKGVVGKSGHSNLGGTRINCVLPAFGSPNFLSSSIQSSLPRASQFSYRFLKTPSNLVERLRFHPDEPCFTVSFVRRPTTPPDPPPAVPGDSTPRVSPPDPTPLRNSDHGSSATTPLHSSEAVYAIAGAFLTPCRSNSASQQPYLHCNSDSRVW
ncbi:hypothetical protein EJ06DRAFT_392294 [Trichodelitschia bisporula]|uniref:Uncharacterized protein n=1 Tax=Trichodelitschia bisporula TaxID=703511 RepID=A0A6G1I0D5_9PEZI|nr:hypothetical protein EJ06DRAFT_392294 [Trichodelitschia bisporula]